MARALNAAYACMVEEANTEGISRAQLNVMLADPTWGRLPVVAPAAPYDDEAALDAWLGEGLSMHDLVSADGDD